MFDLFGCASCSCNREDININIVDDGKQTNNNNSEALYNDKTYTKSKPSACPSINKSEPNDLIIIDYPFEPAKPKKKKDPKIPNLFIEKPQQPLAKPIIPYILSKTEPNKDKHDELNNTLNEEFCEGVLFSKLIVKTEESNYATTFNTKQNYKSRDKDRNIDQEKDEERISNKFLNKSYSGVTASFRTNTMKSKTTNNNIPKDIPTTRMIETNYQINGKYMGLILKKQMPLKVKNDNEKSKDYCIYCEEIYKNCIKNKEILLPLNKPCIYCNNIINQKVLDEFKMKNDNNENDKESNIPHTARHENTRNDNHVHVPMFKSKTITKFNTSKGINKSEIGKDNPNKSLNNSMVKEKQLFTKRYSFLQVNNKAPIKVNNEKSNPIQKEADTKSKDIMKLQKKINPLRPIPIIKPPTKMTISFGDENSQLLFDKKYFNQKQEKKESAQSNLV